MKGKGIVLSVLVLMLGIGRESVQAADKFAPTPAALQSPAAAPVVAPLEVKPLLDTQLEQASEFFTQQNYDAALRAYNDLLASVHDGRREEVLFRIAESYRNLSRTDEAEGVYKMLIENYPDSLFIPTAQYRRAEILYNQAKFAPALALFQTILNAGNADDVTKQAARFFSASCQMKLGQEKDALPVLQTFLDQDPPSLYLPAVAQLLAEYAEKQSDWPGARKAWQTVYDSSKEKGIRAQAAGRAALAALKLTPPQPKEAEKLFRESREADPGSPYVKLANTGLLDLCFQQKRYQEAIDLFNQNRDQFLDSSRPQVFLEVARSYYRSKQLVEAVDGFDVFLSQFKDDPLAPVAAYERLAARSEISRDNLLGDTAAFLAAYPNSSYTPAVLFLRAQYYSGQKQFTEAQPIWDQLAQNRPESLGGQESDILFEAARAHYELHDWKAAADAFARFLQKFPDHPQFLAALQCQAAALQNIPDPVTALAAWEQVSKLAHPKSPEAQNALEQQIVLEEKMGIEHHADLLVHLKALLSDYPQSALIPLAAYTVGAEFFDAKRFDQAEPLLRQAWAADPKAWQVPAVYRLLWIAYQHKDDVQTAALVKAYDNFTDSQATSVRVPAAIYYWLGTEAAKRKQDEIAAAYFTLVTKHPEPATYLTSSWWELAEADRHLKRWVPAVEAYEMFRSREPKSANNSVVLLGLAEAQIGAALYAPAKEHLDHVLLQEPEGKNNAEARFLVGQWYLAQSQYQDALKSFATLSLIYKDDTITPRALEKAAQSADLAGDPVQAENLRKKLRDQYPAFADPNL